MMSSMMLNDVSNGVYPVKWRHALTALRLFDGVNDVGNDVGTIAKMVSRCATPFFDILCSENTYFILSMIEYACSLEFAITR